jgi:hypothetical protein
MGTNKKMGGEYYMKIGIITFHWAINCGAILQAYALQTYLSRMGHEVKIINYIPINTIDCLINSFRTKRVWRIPGNIFECLKKSSVYLNEYQFEKFRKKYLNLSNLYTSNKILKSNPPHYDVYICGSDQIWNPSLTMSGERSYFLDFGGSDIKRIAYAASFGCKSWKFSRSLLANFNAISVRENSGRRIVKEMGINDVCVMPDPTLLLEAKDYYKFVSSVEKGFVFFYILHQDQKVIERVKNYIEQSNKIVESKNVGIEEWLTLIKGSDIVITNSFHGMVFSIIFNKPFIVVLVEKSGMNDRVFTLLERLGLEDRVIEYYNEEKIEDIMKREIDWERVEKEIDCMRKEALNFFEININ